MQVIATAGHVDHGKSALLRALTGMEPDRWDEERRRGLTIDLGFVWMRGADDLIAFVDVPGHERFVGNMLAGVGPVPAALFVVAANEGWMPQSAEHLLALHALGVRHGILAITKTDLADPTAAAEQAREQIGRTSLGEVPVVPVSARTGEGLAELRRSLDDLTARLPPGDGTAPVRLWVDRAFTVRGAGLVVTGTLTAGTVRRGDTLELTRTGTPFVVREIQALNRRVDVVAGVARVALNLRARRDRPEVARGDALATPGSYWCTTVVDVRTQVCSVRDLPREILVHTGSASVPVTVRPLGSDTARFTLRRSLPIRLGERLVLRRDRGVVGGAVVLAVDPPPLQRRGAAQRRAAELQAYPDAPDPLAEVERRGVVRRQDLLRLGIQPPLPPLSGDWLVAPGHQRTLRDRLAALVGERDAQPSARPLRVAEAAAALGLPDDDLVAALAGPPLTVRSGLVLPVDAPNGLRTPVRRALAALARSAQQRPGFHTLTDDELAAAGLSPGDIAAATRSGQVLRLAPGVLVLPVMIERSLDILVGIDQPFTAGGAREALGTSRKVVIPLLEHLARAGRTRRGPDGRHTLTGRESVDG